MEVPTENKSKDFWNDWVQRSFEWESNPDNQRRGYYILKEVTKNRRSKLKILDIGCGSGWLSLELQKYGEVTGIDLSQKAIDDLKLKHTAIKWIAGDFCSLELPNSYFDIVTCLETIAHVPEQMAFAVKIANIMQDDGLLLLTTQNEYIWSRTSWLQPPGEGQIRNWPSRKQLMTLFNSNFTIKKINTCAPGGDQGLPRLFTNRISMRLGSWIFGSRNWIQMLEFMGFGRSLFLVANRKDIENR
jgi:SAM-dependent methyltransferase